MPDYNYWMGGDPDDIRLQCIEITHPSFTKPYRIIAQSINGEPVTVTHEDGTKCTYEHIPVAISKGANSDDLDQSFTVTVGDLGEDFPQEIRRLRNGKYPTVEPTFNYREYNYSDLSKPQVTMLGLQVKDYERKAEGAVFSCQARQLNVTKTGESYNLDDYPTMRGFI